MSGRELPARETARGTSVAGSIGYIAFLGGPPLVGLLTDGVGVYRRSWSRSVPP